MGRHFGDLAFTDSVRRFQEKDGSAAGYARAQARGGRDAVDGDLAAFLARCRSFYLASASSAGWPYIQHRGGPAGFLKPLDAARSVSPITRATGNSSASAISPRTTA